MKGCRRFVGVTLATAWSIASAIFAIWGVLLPVLCQLPPNSDKMGLVAIGVFAAWLVLGAALACRIAQWGMPGEYHWWKGPIERDTGIVPAPDDCYWPSSLTADEFARKHREVTAPRLTCPWCGTINSPNADRCGEGQMRGCGAEL